MRTMTHLFTRSCVMVLATLTGTLLQAQSGEEYYFNGIYNPTLADVHKIDLRPVAYDTILPEKAITYAMLTVKGEVPAHVDSIEAARLNIQLAQEKLYKGFVKAGFGLYTTPLAEIYYDQTRSKSNGYGLHYKHMSSNGGIKDRGPSDYSFNNLDAFYNAYLSHHDVEGRLMYDRRRISYYGYSSTDSLENLIKASPDPPKDALKQVYNDIGFAVRVKSLYKDSTKLAHDVGLEVLNYTNLTKSRERAIGDGTGHGDLWRGDPYRQQFLPRGKGQPPGTAAERHHGGHFTFREHHRRPLPGAGGRRDLRGCHGQDNLPLLSTGLCPVPSF